MFQFESKKVNTILVNNKVWFFSEDIFEALNYSSEKEMLNHLDSIEMAAAYSDKTIISESGVLTAILDSDTPLLQKKFLQWFIETVPKAESFHRTGVVVKL